MNDNENETYEEEYNEVEENHDAQQQQPGQAFALEQDEGHQEEDRTQDEFEEAPPADQ
jgi:hypothetical protein